MTLAHRIGQALPRPLRSWLAPKWYLIRDVTLFLRRGGRLRWDATVKEWVGIRRFGGKAMPIPIRSYRQLRRYLQFNMHGNDVLQDWLYRIKDCEVLYDIGPSNGLEGFLANHLWNSRVVFIDPSVPSIESILKAISLPDCWNPDHFDVILAGCDSEMGYKRILAHEVPNPGSTYYTVDEPGDYCRGGRKDEPVFCHHLAMTVSLDGLSDTLGLPAPTHVKIDVDGFEGRVLAGATRLLSDRTVRSWAIELSDVNVEPVRALMARHGYVEVAVFNHYPDYEYYCGDSIFVRDDLVAWWNSVDRVH